MAVVSALLFAWVAGDVVAQGPMSGLDASGLVWLASGRSAFLDDLMSWASLSGGPSATSVYVAILMAVYFLRRRVASAFAVGAIVYGSAVLNVALKHLIQRDRPVIVDPQMALSTYSFPSGHAAASTVFAGLLCLLVLRSKVPRTNAAIAIAAAALWTATVCISRAYLGLHYPTDIVAGIAEGVCWLMLATLALDWVGVSLR